MLNLISGETDSHFLSYIMATFFYLCEIGIKNNML